MDLDTRKNWCRIKTALESTGKTDCHFYRRAVVICNGGNDLMEHPFGNQDKSDLRCDSKNKSAFGRAANTK